MGPIGGGPLCEVGRTGAAGCTEPWHDDEVMGREPCPHAPGRDLEDMLPPVDEVGGGGREDEEPLIGGAGGGCFGTM
jgi:hypothetical protein